MTAGDVTVSLAVGSHTVQQLVQPGMTHRVRLLGYIDGVQRLVDVDVSVFGMPCPDPGAHLLDCAETRHDEHGDCDGPVRLYVIAATGSIEGKAAGDTVPMCAAHAQINGRHIRKAPR